MASNDALAVLLGCSNNETNAEQLRIDHGPFFIPYPEYSTPMESPFGLVLTGNPVHDRERVQVRIAAVQAGLHVDIYHKGKVIFPLDKMTIRQERIMILCDYLDGIYERCLLGGFAPNPKVLPWGFNPADWANPRQIQERIVRDVPAGESVVLPWWLNLQGEQTLLLLPHDFIMEDYNLSDFLQDWVLQEEDEQEG